MTSLSDRFQRRVSKLEALCSQTEVTIPEEVLEWQRSRTMDENRSCLAFSRIPKDERPSDMLNPYDVIYQRLSRNAFQWAHSLSHQANIMIKKDDGVIPTWCLIVVGILEYEKRLHAGIAHTLPEGQPPLHWSDYTETMPYARQPGQQEVLKMTKNYRKRSQVSDGSAG